MEMQMPEAGYRRVDTIRVSIDERKRKATARESLPEWVDCERVVGTAAMGTPKSTAQVHPRLLTNALLSAAQKKGTDGLPWFCCSLVLDIRRLSPTNFINARLLIPVPLYNSQPFITRTISVPTHAHTHRLSIIYSHIHAYAHPRTPM